MFWCWKWYNWNFLLQTLRLYSYEFSAFSASFSSKPIMIIIWTLMFICPWMVFSNILRSSWYILFETLSPWFKSIERNHNILPDLFCNSKGVWHCSNYSIGTSQTLTFFGSIYGEVKIRRQHCLGVWQRLELVFDGGLKSIIWLRL